MHLPNETLLQGGKYKIVRFLSSGGFGNTYEAIDVECNKKNAIKEFFMKDSCNRDETTYRVIVATKSKEEQVTRMKNKFMKEACALQNMSHPNIVHMENAFEENATAYYVMDYIEGTSLNDIIKVAGSLSEAKALDYIMQIAEALRYVHSKNILHLDVKPGNIMVDKNGKAILIDFGASKQYDEVTGENTSTLLGVNTTGYAPAEQSYRGFVQFAPSTDIYALGATLYKLLTGITPPDAQMLKDGEAELAPLPSNISASVKNAVREAMRPLRKDRPQSVDEFVAILSEKQSVSTNYNASHSLDSKKNVVINEETIIDSDNKLRAKSPKSQKSDQEIKDEAWDIAKKYPLGFREYINENAGSLDDVSYCRMVLRDKTFIKRNNPRFSKEQDYNTDAQKLFKKYGEVVSLENCKKILIEEKGNFATAEQRVAKWVVNKRGAKLGTKANYENKDIGCFGLLLAFTIYPTCLIGLCYLVFGENFPIKGIGPIPAEAIVVIPIFLISFWLAKKTMDFFD